MTACSFAGQSMTDPEETVQGRQMRSIHSSLPILFILIVAPGRAAEAPPLAVPFEASSAAVESAPDVRKPMPQSNRINASRLSSRLTVPSNTLLRSRIFERNRQATSVPRQDDPGRDTGR